MGAGRVRAEGQKDVGGGRHYDHRRPVALFPFAW
jgi:hypothetical protein